MKARYKLYKTIKTSESKPSLQTSSEQIPVKHGGYKAALFREEWRIKRLEILKRDYQKCCNCDAHDELQVHHRQYHFSVKNQKFLEPWEYPSDLLITLCRRCHNIGHNKYQVPIIKTH
jgi:5-methylcytosine-specific restriction endonuclease McrA